MAFQLLGLIVLRERIDDRVQPAFHHQVELMQREPDPMAELLATLVERGQLNTNAARQLLKLHREQTDGDA